MRSDETYWRQHHKDNADIISHWKFSATLQLRTPLRVLRRHGEKHYGPDAPPHVATEMWMGVWVPVVKTWSELTGIPGIPEFTSGTSASTIGQVPADGGDFLKFLLAVRTILERDSSIEDRLFSLRDELETEQWADVCRKLGGKRAAYGRIWGQFFPSFVSTIPRLPRTAAYALEDAGLDTPAKLNATLDADLLAIKGIGPAKLASIRKACIEASDENATNLDLVQR